MKRSFEAKRDLRGLVALTTVALGVISGPASGAGPAATFHLSAYGAQGNGSADDTGAMQSALNAASAAGGGTVVADSSTQTFLVSRLDMRGPNVTLDLDGSTMKAAPSTGPMVHVTGDGDGLANMTVDANQVARTAVEWAQGANGTIRNVHLTNGPYVGLQVDQPAVVTASAVTADSFQDVCFDVSGTLLTSAAHAERCGYAGFYFGQTSTGDVLDGTSTQNTIGAIMKNAGGGHIAHFVSNDDNRFGLLLDTGTANWTADTVETDRAGNTARYHAATGVELVGATHNTFNTVISNANTGYAFALTVGSNDNTVTSLSADDTGAFNSNPGLLLDTGASNNRIAKAAVTGYTVCLHVGETDPRAPTANWIGELDATRCLFNAIRIDFGAGNVVDKAIVVDCGALDVGTSPEPGTVDFAGSSSNNVVRDLEQQQITQANVIPRYAVYFAPATSGNGIDGGRLRSWKLSPVHDDGHNYAPFDASGNFIAGAGAGAEPSPTTKGGGPSSSSSRSTGRTTGPSISPQGAPPLSGTPKHGRGLLVATVALVLLVLVGGWVVAARLRQQQAGGFRD